LDNEQQDIAQGFESIFVEEDDAVYDFAYTALSSIGCMDYDMADGANVIELIEKKIKVDLLIIDLIMPKKNGKE